MLLSVSDLMWLVKILLNMTCCSLWNRKDKLFISFLPVKITYLTSFLALIAMLSFNLTRKFAWVTITCLHIVGENIWILNWLFMATLIRILARKNCITALSLELVRFCATAGRILSKYCSYFLTPHIWEFLCRSLIVRTDERSLLWTLRVFNLFFHI